MGYGVANPVRCKAKLIDNISYCSECGSELDRIKDYKSVSIECENYTEFIRECGNPKCCALVQYTSLISLEGTIRKVFDEEDLIEIKEEDNV